MRRFALRDLRSDEGLGLIETVVALFVFSLIMAGLAASMVMFAHQTVLSHARAAASSIAQQYTEKARAVGTTQLENCNTASGKSAPPGNGTTNLPYRGDSGHQVIVGADGYCIPYSATVTQENVNFTLTRLVLLKAQGNDVSGQAINEKYLVVQVSWTDAGGAAKTYELDTIFTQKGSITAAPAQGIRFVIKDINGNILTADSSSWAIVIKNSSSGSTVYTSPDAVTAEGTYSQVDLSPGTYWCQATSTDDSSAAYFPGVPPTYNSGDTLSASVSGGANDTVGGSCTVTASTVTDFVTTWQSSTDCATSATATGTVNFTVTDANNTVLSAMTVKLTQLSDVTKFYSKNTNTSGVASGIKPVANWYTYTVTDAAGNYVTANNSYGPICVVAGTTNSYTVKMSSVSGCSTTGSNATVNITAQDASTGTKLSGYKVWVINSSTYTATAFPNTSPQGLASKAVAPGSYYYLVGLPGSSTYQGSGWLGNADGTPLCLTSGETRNITVGLNAATCTRTTGKNAYVTMTVVDTAGNAINGATIHLINVNGDGDYTATTGSDGKPTTSNTVGGVSVKSIKTTDVDPFEYLIEGPNGNYLTSGVLGPVCTTQNALTTISPNPALQGIFNLTVTVQNNDTIAWKTYTISVIDSTGKTQQTQNVSVPDCSGCNANPSPGVGFTGLKTGSYYIQVCSQIKTNCSLVDTAPTQSGGTVTYYQFLTPGTTYTASTTGYGDLATVDDSGGA